MDGEIVIERNDGNVMKLDDNEQAILDEISLDFAKPPRPQMMNRSRLSPEPQPTKRRTQTKPGRLLTLTRVMASAASTSRSMRVVSCLRRCTWRLAAMTLR